MTLLPGGWTVSATPLPASTSRPTAPHSTAERCASVLAARTPEGSLQGFEAAAVPPTATTLPMLKETTTVNVVARKDFIVVAPGPNR
ncbi:hypothetical protein GCM10010522_45810 [Kribbella solani]